MIIVDHYTLYLIMCFNVSSICFKNVVTCVLKRRFFLFINLLTDIIIVFFSFHRGLVLISIFVLFKCKNSICFVLSVRFNYFYIFSA